MTREEFEEAVMRSIELLPEEFKSQLENTSVIVEDYPTQAQRKRMGLKDSQTLLGLYEGVPLTKQHSISFTNPDRITIFQKPIENECRYLGVNVQDEITRVVKHEIAHHFGISDERLDEIEKRPRGYRKE